MAKRITNVLGEGRWGTYYLINTSYNIIIILRQIKDFHDLENDILFIIKRESKKIQTFNNETKERLRFKNPEDFTIKLGSIKEISTSLIKFHYLLKFKKQYVKYANLYRFPVYEFFPRNIKDYIKKGGLKNLEKENILDNVDIEKIIKYAVDKIEVHKK